MTAAESEFLLCLAALSLSFVGFSAIVVTLRGAMGGALSARQIRLVCLYIEGGLLVTAIALAPSLLNLLHIAGSVIWTLCSAGAATIFIFFLAIQFRRRRAIETGELPTWVIVINVVSIAMIAGLWFNAAGFPFAPSIGTFAAALTWALCVFGFIFVRTIELFLHQPPPS
jgi:hypothetical protein